jgi:signal recognition particle subunit SRP19
MRCELEDKAYSRDFWCRGRVRVEWKRDDGSFVREELNTRGKLLRAIAAAVKAHPERGENGKPGTNPRFMTQHRVFEEYLKQVAGAAGPAPGQGKKAEKARSGKKGKKGRT